ncbi:MAG TPA: cytochrome C oxidase subunit I, partial [Burkholderiaceae bacterium]|nr:cytochrome C oxidase subunit I [Burkholderiaceae bacterium]
IGMIVMTFPWHLVGILGMPRRMAYFDYSNPAIAPQAIPVIISFIGGLLLLASALLFIYILLRSHFASRITLPEFRFSVPVHQPSRLPVALNSFGLWLALMIGLTVINYGFPIAQLMSLQQTSVPAISIGTPR